MKFDSKFPARLFLRKTQADKQIPNSPPDFSFEKLRRTSKFQSGFTVIEILIAIGLLVIIISLGLFLSLDIYRTDSMSAERDRVLGILHNARTRSINNVNESRHGVYFDSDKFVLFQGSSYNPSDPQNKDFEYATSIIYTNPFEITFEQLTGNASNTGSIVLSGQGRTATISFNSEGRIGW